MKYYGHYRKSKSSEDLGIDLHSAELVVIQPGETAVVDTGTAFEFPLFGKLRRIISSIVFGVECTGIGGLLKPRGRHNYAILAGVVDAGYRGTIKVRIFNPTNETLYIPRGDRLAQMILIPVLHTEFEEVLNIDNLGHTKRESSGGINIDVR